MIDMSLRGEVWMRVQTPREEVPQPSDQQGWNDWWLAVRSKIRDFEGGYQYQLEFSDIHDEDPHGECIIAIYRQLIPV